MLRITISSHHSFVTPHFYWGISSNLVNSQAAQFFILYAQTIAFHLPHRYIINLQYIENSAHTPP